MHSRCLALITSFFVLVAAAHAQRRPISTFESDIRIDQTGSALVIESYEFPNPSGSFDREIVTDIPGSIGNRSFFIDVATVNDDSGSDVPYRVKRVGDRLDIHVPRIPDRHLQIAYRIRNAVQFGSETDEFLWIANNPSSPTDTSAFTITLPDACANQFRAQTFLRDDGINPRTSLWSFNGQVVTIVNGSTAEAVSPGALVPGIGVVLYVSLPSGVLTAPGMLTRIGWFIRANPIVLLPLVVLAVMLVIWRVKPRNPDPGRSIAPMYEPPEGLTPAEVGTLVDDSVDPRDVTATLIDLAVRGYVRLEKIAPEYRAGGAEDYVVRLLKPKEQWAGLKPHEHTMMFHTFYGGQWTKLSSLKLRFPDIVPYMRSSIFTSLKRAGMYRVDPDNAPALQQGVILLVYFLLWALVRIPWISLVSLAQSWALTLLSLAISAVIVFAFGRKTSPKTMAGMRTYIAIRGFEDFIRTVESDKLQRLEPDLFERYLPYAMALGIEHRWTQAFEGIAVKRPDWIELTDELFDTTAFGDRLESVFAGSILSVPRGRMPMQVAELFGNGETMAKMVGR